MFSVKQVKASVLECCHAVAAAAAVIAAAAEWQQNGGDGVGDAPMDADGGAAAVPAGGDGGDAAGEVGGAAAGGAVPGDGAHGAVAIAPQAGAPPFPPVPPLNFHVHVPPPHPPAMQNRGGRRNDTVNEYCALFVALIGEGKDPQVRTGPAMSMLIACTPHGRKQAFQLSTCSTCSQWSVPVLGLGPTILVVWNSGSDQVHPFWMCPFPRTTCSHLVPTHA